MSSETEKYFALGEVQTWMLEALVHTGANTSHEDIIARIAPSATLSPQQCLAIYQRGYYARLVQCMEGQFKALRHALGKELFTDFAVEYLKVYPSQSPTLSELGRNFTGYLASTRPDRDAPEQEEWIDFMVDLARFEWDLYTVFDAEGNEGMPYAKLGADDNNIRLQPCFSLHTYRFPVSDYYNEVARENDPEIPLAYETKLAIVRKDFSIGIFTLLAPQFHFLTEMKNGATVSDALLRTAQKFNSAPEAAAKAWSEWRKHWIKSGFFIDGVAR